MFIWDFPISFQYTTLYERLSEYNLKNTKRNLPVASFTEEVNLRLAKRLLVFNGRLANRRLTS